MLVDLTKVLKGFESGWVAISSDYRRVVAQGKDLKTLREKIKNKPKGSVYLMPVVKDFSNIVTSAR